MGEIRMTYPFMTIAPHEGVRVDDLPPHSTYYNCACEQENQQTNDNVLDSVLTMTVWLNYELKMLRNLKALYKYTDKFLAIFSLVDASSRLDRKRLGNFVGKRESQTDRDRDRERQRQTETETQTQT